MDHSSNINIGKLASVNGSRSTFNRDRFINATFESGRLIPFYCEEVIPHDTFKLDMNLLIRSITPVAPTLDNAWLDVFFFGFHQEYVQSNLDNLSKYMEKI